MRVPSVQGDHRRVSYYYVLECLVRISSLSHLIYSIPKKQFHISTVSNKVYDITERKNFCSSDCFKASNYLKVQLLTSPLWLRDVEDIPEFKLLSLD